MRRITCSIGLSVLMVTGVVLTMFFSGMTRLMMSMMSRSIAA